MLNDSKAIRPEIKGLFETVKQQSMLYVDAFEKLEQNHNEYKSLINDLNNLAESLTLKINHEIFSLKQKYDSITKILTIETTKTNEKYKELVNITQLQESYNNAIESIKIIRETLEKNTLQLRRDSEEFNRELKFIKNNAESEINSLINNSDELIRKIVEEEIEIIDLDFNAKLKVIDGRLSKVEQSTTIINNQLNTDFRRIYQDIDTLRNLVRNLNKREDEEALAKFDDIKRDLSRIELNISGLSDDVFGLKVKSESTLEEIFKRKSISDDLGGNSVMAFFGKDYEEEYKKLENKIEDISETNNNLNTKYYSMRNIAIVAIVLSAISIIASIIVSI